jgi:hypothetical protein
MIRSGPQIRSEFIGWCPTQNRGYAAHGETDMKVNETIHEYQERMRGYRREFEDRHPSARGRWNTVAAAYEDSLHNYAYLGWLSMCDSDEPPKVVCTWTMNPANVVE